MPTLLDFTKGRAFWPVVFGVYFAAQAVLRIGLGDKMNIDEAEAWLWAQNLAWGYGPQPPLYIWLQRAVFSLIGANAVGLAVLKALLLLGIFLASTGLARRWSGSVPDAAWIAGAAALTLFWLPELAWESQRIRTHNVLTALVALLSTWQLLRLLAAPSRGNHVLLGLLIGLGLLSKWNFALYAAALVAAPILSRGAPQSVRPAALWVLLLPVLMIAPTVVWMLTHPDIAFASYGKLGIADRLGLGEALLAWLGAFAEGGLAFGAFPLLALGAFALFGRRRAEVAALSDTARTEMRLVVRVVGLALVLLLASGALGGATQLKARWLLPLVLPVFPVLGTWLGLRLRVGARRAFVAATVVVQVVLLAGIAYMLRFDPTLPGFDARAAAAALPDNDPTNPYLAKVEIVANLKVWTPDRTLADPSLMMDSPCPEGVTLLDPGLVNHAGLARWFAACGLAPEGEPAPLEGTNGQITVQRFTRR